jgi:hypothetical protein
MSGHGAALVGVVDIGQKIDVGLHVGKHPAHDMTFSCNMATRTIAPAARVTAACRLSSCCRRRRLPLPATLLESPSPPSRW